MLSSMPATSAQERAGETKRARSRQALLSVARDVFGRRGWQGTRVEDVARLAGVSPTTAYKHFKNKQALIGHAYAPLISGLRQAAERDVEHECPPMAAIRRHVYDLAVITRQHRDLTVALVAAMQEQSYKAGDVAADPDDVRNLVPMAEPLSELIGYGQRAGAFKAELAAADLGSYHTSALLFRVLSSPGEQAQETASMALQQLLPALLAEPQGLSEWSLESDLAPVLRRLVGRDGGDGAPERRRLANDSLTKAFVEAGFRLLTRECGDRPGEPTRYLAFLRPHHVLDELRQQEGEEGDEKALRARWPSDEDFALDILCYASEVKNWWPHALVADNVGSAIPSAADLVGAVQEACYQDQVSALNDPAVPLTYLSAALAARHPELKQAVAARSRQTHLRWTPIYRQTLSGRGVELRPGVTMEDLANVLTALSDGFLLRSMTDADADFIDHENRRTLFGRAALAVIVACVDPGDGQPLEEAFREMFED